MLFADVSVQNTSFSSSSTNYTDQVGGPNLSYSEPDSVLPQQIDFCSTPNQSLEEEHEERRESLND